MKKTLSMLAVLVMGLVMVLPFSVFAVSENDIINKLSETQIINGREVSVKSDVLNEVKAYLTEFDLTDAECKVISDNIDKAVALAKSEKAVKWNDLSASGKASMLSYFQAIVDGTSINATLTNDGVLTVYSPTDGSVFCKINDAVTDKASAGSTTIVNTGVTSIIVVIVAIVAAAGCVVVTKNVSKANA